MVLNVVFFGTPEFAVPILKALVKDTRIRVSGVVTAPDRPVGRGLKTTPPPVKKVALEHNIPILQPESLKNPDVHKWISRLMPDYLVVAAYGKIIPDIILRIPRIAPVNVHASLLPEYRGASPVTHALLDGKKETGITFMIMTEKLDAGPILARYTEPIRPDDTTETLEHRLALLGAQHIADVLEDYANGKLQAIPQDDSRASFAPRLKKDDGWIDWNAPADYIERFVRAMNPWPLARTRFRNRDLILWKARVVPCPDVSGVHPGATLSTDKGRWIVTTGDGCLELIEVQPSGKKRMSGADFINGYRVKPGDKFESHKRS